MKFVCSKRLSTLLILVCLIVNNNVFARFHQDDADAIDSDRLLDTEFFLNRRGYLPINHISSDWDSKKIGFRLSSGSLGLSRSFLYEEIKLGFENDHLLFGVNHLRQEDTLGISESKEAYIGINSIPLFQFLLLADGGTYKKWADVGGRIRFQIPYLIISSEMWSVDQYYNDKTDNTNRYEEKPITQMHDVKLQFPWFGFHGNSYSNSPLVWNRSEDSFIYKNEFTKNAVLVRFGSLESYHIVLSHTQESKNESKETVSPQSYGFKSLERTHQVSELVVASSQKEENRRTFGLFLMQRDSEYTAVLPEELLNSNVFAGPDNSLKRAEEGILATYQHRAGDSKWQFFQWGLYGGNVKIEERQANAPNTENSSAYTAAYETPKTEVVMQWGWGFVFDKGGTVFLNTLWDIDQIERDFPYDENPFNPFSGLNFQMQLAI